MDEYTTHNVTILDDDLNCIETDEIITIRTVDYYIIFKENLDRDGYLLVEDGDDTLKIDGDLTETSFKNGTYDLQLENEVHSTLSRYALVDGYKNGSPIRVKVYLS